jgi:hypothetical protein
VYIVIILFYVLFLTSNTGRNVTFVGSGVNIKKRTIKNIIEHDKTNIDFNAKIANYLM